MSKLAKLAFIVIVAVLAIAAKQFATAPEMQNLGVHAVPGASISPEEITRAAGPLPEPKVDSYY